VKVIKEPLYVDKLNREANLYIGLPDEYNFTNINYPVVYFHDGHNLFYAEDSYAGETWDVAQAFSNKKIPPCIVVALSCATKGNQRIEEYNVFDSRFPTHPTWVARGRGMEYLDVMFHQIKPDIDRRFRTKTQPEHTYMIGSSMGGVISLEAGFIYPEYVQNIAGLSNAFYASTKKIIQLIEQKPLLLKKLYLDTGDQEAGLEIAPAYLASNAAIKAAIEKKQAKTEFRFEIIQGGQHNETAWKKRLPNILQFLFSTFHQ
jgi:predicted alpha/beta superfamily hydrolase